MYGSIYVRINISRNSVKGMEIKIFSSKRQPYGLLSNNAIVPMTINDQKWLSVTEYVYVNLFTSDVYREKMRQKYQRNPFDAALELKNKEDEMIYLNAILYGTQVRFEQNGELMKKLQITFPKYLKVLFGNEDESRQLQTLFNRLRSDRDHIYDDKYGKVPFEQVNAVVVGVANKLMVNPQMKTEPFSDLKQFAAVNPIYRRDLVNALNNLDEIVPVLKIKLKDKIYAKQLEQFKSYLLDVTLDFILETKYPHIPSNQYHRAKAQQIRKEQNLLFRYEEQLYNLYVNDGLPVEIIDKLNWKLSIPDSSLVTVEQIDTITDADDAAVIAQPLSLMDDDDTIVISDNHEFLPSYPDTIRIDGKTYRSVIAYAYFVLFSKQLGITDIDVNTFELETLVMEYGRIKNEKIADILTNNNAIAMNEKFNSSESLRSLLRCTDMRALYWADPTDQVLGMGGTAAPNRAGTYLEYLRNIANETPSVELDDIVLKHWFIFRAEDYANTLKLFKNKTLEALEIIYNKKVTDRNQVIPPNASKLMNEGGLNQYEQRVAYPLIHLEYNEITKKTDIDIDTCSRAIVELYDVDNVTPKQRAKAELNLGRAYELVKRDVICNKNTFIGVILSNQPQCTLKQEEKWRIRYFSSW